MRSPTVLTPDTTLRQEFVRRASAYVGVIVLGLVLTLFVGGFLVLDVWAALRTGRGVSSSLFSFVGFIVVAGFSGALAILLLGVRRLRRGDTVALVLTPEGVALPEQLVPTLPWPHLVATDRTYGRGACLRQFLDDPAARQVRPHAVQRLYVRLGNLHRGDALYIAPQGLAMELDEVLALIRAYAAAHGGPQSTRIA